MQGAIDNRSTRWLQIGSLVMALVAAVYLLVLQLTPAGECGRDSPFWFGAAVSETFIDYGGLDEEAGWALSGEAAREYADELLLRDDYQLVPDESGAYLLYTNQGVMFGKLSIFETPFGRYLVGGHSVCVKRFEAFTHQSA